MLKASKYEASHKIRFLRVVKDDDVDRDRTVSRRSEPSSRATLMGEQPNPWAVSYTHLDVYKRQGLVGS